MFGIKLYHINNKINYLIETCFTIEDNPKVVLIFDNIDYDPLKEDVWRITNLPEFIDSEFGDDEKEFIIWLSIPEEYLLDFKLFKEGRYSKFSDKYKEVLIKSYTSKRGEGFSRKSGLPNVSVYDAINPNKELRDAMAEHLNTKEKIVEVLDAPKLEEEEFKNVSEIYDKTGQDRGNP
jgi:hypothetical protein